MRIKLLTLLIPLLFVGCGSYSIAPHKIEIQQGNLVTQEMVAKLTPGMTRTQVRSVLGSPLITDTFHDNRWDYVYRLEQKGKLVEQSKLTVYFEGDKLTHIESGFSSSFTSGSPPKKLAPEIGKTAVPVKPMLLPPVSGQATMPMQPMQAQPPTPPVPGRYLMPVAPPAQVPPAVPAELRGVKTYDITVSPDSAAPGSRQAPAQTEKGAEQPIQEKGFFGRMLEKIGL